MFDKELATIQLFNTVIIDEPNKSISENAFYFSIKALNYGLNIHPVIFENLENPHAFYEEVINKFGVKAKAINSTFFSNFEAVQNTPDDLRIFMQMLHYACTYGGWNIHDPYTPNKLSETELEQAKVAFEHCRKIDAITSEELHQTMQQTLYTSFALDKGRLDSLECVVKAYNIKLIPEKIQNKEFACMYSEITNILPKKPEAMLRYLIYLTTNQTLLIKSEDLINRIYNCYYISQCFDAFKTYIEEYDGEKQFAKIFYRFKSLFLALKKAFKNGDTNATIKQKEYVALHINRIRRLAKIYHEPMKQVTLANLAPNITTLFSDEIHTMLKQATIYQLIKVYNAINHKLYSNIMFKSDELIKKSYHIRNGKDFIAGKENMQLSLKKSAKLVYTRAVIESLLAQKLSHLKGQKILLNQDITYGVPISAKTFTGNLPYGTTFDVGEKLIVGVAWEVDADIDLSATYQDGRNIAWYHSWQDDDTVFTGDMTELNRYGYATEFISTKAKKDMQSIIMNLNLYRNWADKVPFKLIIGTNMNHKKIEKSSFDYVKSISDVISVKYAVPFDDLKDGLSLGYTQYAEGNMQFVVSNVSNLGHQIARRGEEMLEALKNQAIGKLTFNDLLEKVGAEIIYEKPENIIDKNGEIIEPEYIDMTVETISVDKFLKLLNPEN